MDRAAVARWLGGLAVVFLLGIVLWRQQQIVRNEGEILRQIRELQASSDRRTAEPPARQAAPPAAIPDLTLRIEGAAIEGEANAKLVVVEFSDFECPYCGRYARDTFPQLERDYIRTGRIRYAFRHAPIERIHPSAMKAAEAGECARQQGRFWPFHDRLFANQRLLAPPALLDHARAIGLNMKTFETCLDGQASATVHTDLDAGLRAGITATPAFFIGFGQRDGSVHVLERLQGAKPYTTFQTVLEGMLRLPDAR